MTIPQPGQMAPEFCLADETGRTRKLSDYRGRHVLLYFYPKDDTPGCTVEACNFRDDYSAYEEADVVILGVSPDDPKSHTKFKKKFDLPFTLLADTDHQVAEKYGVWGNKNMFGIEFDGVLRTTFLIGPEGEIVKTFEKVRPTEHSAEVLELLGNG